MELQQEISTQINQSKVGKSLKVLFDRKEGLYFVGRSEYDSPEVDNEVIIQPKENQYLRVGDFVNATITSADAFDLFGITSE